MRKLVILILFLCGVAHAETMSLAWWLMPDEQESLPHDLEEDDSGSWSELWQRPDLSSTGSPSTVMEQGLGARWVGIDPDKNGVPSHTLLVLAGRKIVDLDKDKVRLGTIENEEIRWADGASQKVFEPKRRHRRKRASKKVNFGKIILPPLTNKNTELSAWTVEGLARLLQKLPDATTATFSPRDLSVVAHLGDPSGSILNFRYSPRCGLEERIKIEDVIAEQVEPKLTCLMDQDPAAALKILAVLQLRPLIECKSNRALPLDTCGQATPPLVKEFFGVGPQINLFIDRCEDDLGDTVQHEIFHLVGIKDNSPEALKAYIQGESCRTHRATLEFENTSEEYYNDLQVETRISLFRKVRDESVTKWNWTEGERAFMLGTICAKMGDKFCARRYFQNAAETSLPGFIELPEGTEIAWSALAQFQLYDSISEDIQRMHELVRYLHRDPNGILLRRMETGVHRVHELYVAREALQAVKENRGICGSETDEHILCEDLAQLVKTPWFQRP